MRAFASWLILAALTACDRSDTPASGTVTVATPASASPPAPAASSPIVDRVERQSPAVANRVVASPPPGDMRPTKDFTDPPLPRELTDDGGLAPLPPRAPKIQAEEDQR